MAVNMRRQPLYDQLVDILSEKIEYEYRPGDLMPSERELSERYGLSRTTGTAPCNRNSHCDKEHGACSSRRLSCSFRRLRCSQ